MVLEAALYVAVVVTGVIYRERIFAGVDYPPVYAEDDATVKGRAALLAIKVIRVERAAKDPAVRAARAAVRYAVPAMIAACFLLYAHEDGVLWQLAEGRSIVHDRGLFAVGGQDTLSFTSKGKPWINYAWLSSVVFYNARACRHKQAAGASAA